MNETSKLYNIVPSTNYTLSLEACLTVPYVRH